ncbi:AAA family ATPase [Gemmatimonadota bacterium]
MYSQVWEELASTKQMVFMAGPRQTGKTTLALAIVDRFTNHAYLNWDVLTDRKRLVTEPYFFETMERRDQSVPLVVLDEIHKYRGWKNYLKGAYDRYHDEFRFLVTGSGRLDTYRKGGDSLAGRYALFRLWPFTVAELAGCSTSLEQFRADPLGIVTDEDGRIGKIWTRLARFSGFPEPYVQASAAINRKTNRMKEIP